MDRLEIEDDEWLFGIRIWKFAFVVTK